MAHDVQFEPRPDRPRGRRRRLVLLLLLAVVGGLFVVRAAVDVWAGRRLNEEIQRLTLKYGAFGRHGDLRRAENAPNGQNLAIVMGAAALLAADTPLPLQLTALRFLSSTPADGSPMPEHLRAFHAANRDAIRLAVSGRHRTHTNWPDAMRDDDGMPSLLCLRGVSAALWVESRFNLEHSRADEAAAAVAAGLALAASLRYELPEIVQLMRSEITHEQVAALRDLLIRADPSEPALAELAALLRVGRTRDPVLAGLIGQMKLTDDALARMESGDPGVDDWGVSPSFRGWWAGPLLRFGRPVIRMARLRLLQEMDRVIQLQAALPVTSSRELLIAHKSRAWWLWWTQGYGRDRQSTLELGNRRHAERNAAELAVALRRYRLATGSYPDDPNVLAPQYLDRIGVDPFTGRPIEYARQGSGFVLRIRWPVGDTAGAQAPANRFGRVVDWTFVR